MEIVIRRTHKTEVAVDGHLSINNERVCDTAECREKLLPAGEYPIPLVKCKQYGRRCVCIGLAFDNPVAQTDSSRVVKATDVSALPTTTASSCVGDPIKNRCATCTQLRTEYVNNNTVMPKVCPMLKMGNGVIARPDGSIILGERVGGAETPVWGSMIHTKAAYDRVFDCVRKNLERGHEVRLRIM